MTRTAVKPPTRSAYTPAMTRKPRKRKLRLDRFGRVKIPQDLLDQTKLAPGDAVEIAHVPGGVLVRRAAGRGLVMDRGRLVHDGVADEDLIEAIERIKNEDDERLLRRCTLR
jgi:bifunctional DNA-binding transcriptional regulator/antitoxin component of YhaV-PrlF toxin-antitoxin module